MIKLAAFDIDGTLFDEVKKEFPPSAVEALRLLHENGTLIVAATGRPPASAAKLHNVGIYPDYFVCSNGHLVLNGQGEILIEQGFPPALSQAVWDYCRERDIGLLWKYPDRTYVYRGDEEFEKIFAKNAKVSPDNPPVVIYDDRQIHLTRSPNGGCLACAVEELAAFNAAFEGQCRAVDINGRSSDLMLWGVNKQVGFQRLLEHIGIPPEDCIAFGDNLNDLEILRFVGVGVAMGNGDPRLQAQSDYVTQAVDADGIYLGLKHFDLI